MATRKAKPAAELEAKAGASGQASRANGSGAAVATPSSAGMQRLLREAAWSRMFGRIDAKNPFTRSR